MPIKRVAISKQLIMRKKSLLWPGCLAVLWVLWSPSALGEEDTGVQKAPAPIIMGIFPRRSAIDTARLFKPLADYLTSELGRPVELALSRDFKSFWKGVEQGRFDLVHYNQYHYVKSHRLYGYRVILKNEEHGMSTISGTLVVRKDSGFTRVADLRGKKIVFGGGRSAMQSYIVATYLLRQGGLRPGDYEEQFTITPPNAILAPYYGEADAGGIGDAVIKLPVITRKIDTSQLTFLAKSKQLAHLPWAVDSSMPDELAKRLQDIMSALHKSEEGRAVLESAVLTRLHKADDKEYDPHRQIVLEVLGEQY